MKIKVQIFKGQKWNDKWIEGQLIIVQGTPCIIPLDNHLPGLPFDNCLQWDGHHLQQEVDAPLWVRPETVEFVREEEIEVNLKKKIPMNYLVIKRKPIPCLEPDYDLSFLGDYPEYVNKED